MDSYDKRSQIGASRHRMEDALALHNGKRWLGSIYLGGYAIECSLKALICYYEDQDNFKNTSPYKKGNLRGSELHNLTKLLRYSTEVKRVINIDRTGKYQKAWDTVSTLWRSADLRYSEESGNEADSDKFIKAAKELHNLFLHKQGVRL